MRAVVYAATRNLYRDMLPSIKSLLLNNWIDKVYLLIEDDVFPYYLPPCCETINVSGQEYFRQDSPNIGCRWTWMVLMRAALPFVFPDLDRILSLDCDTIITADISELWDLPLDDYYFAACREPATSAGGIDCRQPLYCNMGVSMFNLKKLRDDGAAKEVISLLNRRLLPFPEQDALNIVCQSAILPISSKYNKAECTEPVGYAKIVHYAAISDWTSKPLVQEYARRSF